MRSRLPAACVVRGQATAPEHLDREPEPHTPKDYPLATIGHAPVARNQPDRPRDAASGANTQAVSRVRASGNVMDTRRTEATTSEPAATRRLANTTNATRKVKIPQ